jgi:hypothetical protein
MPTSVRLLPEEERALRRIARRRKTTVSAVIRDAVSELVEEEKNQKPYRPYQRVAHLIGSVHGLDPDLSQRTGERFSQMLREKARRRR